jgi:hypothetical protein
MQDIADICARLAGITPAGFWNTQSVLEGMYLQLLCTFAPVVGVLYFHSRQTQAPRLKTGPRLVSPSTFRPQPICN